MSIEVSNLSKSYETVKAVDGISFSLKKGEIVGFLGPNGAGKSTVMKVLTGYIKDFEGSVLINGIAIKENKLKAQKHIGYLPEHNPLYLEMYVKEYLVFNAEIYKVPKSNIQQIISAVGLEQYAGKKIRELSKGYRQRVGIAAALLHNPDVLILDEPTTGLDPNQLIEIRSLIKRMGKDKTILFSTHILQEIEAVCDRVIIINKGKIVSDRNLNELQKNQQQRIVVEFDYAIEKEILAKISGLKSSDNLYGNTWELAFASEKDKRADIFDFANMQGLKILSLIKKDKNLEKIFSELTQR